MNVSKKQLLAFFGLLLVAVFGLALSGWGKTYAEGSRTGVVMSVARKGLLWKSWEGTLNQGGVIQGYDERGKITLIPNSFKFHVEDPALVKKLQTAAQNNCRVELVYQGWFIKPLTIEEANVVVDVRDISGSKHVMSQAGCPNTVFSASAK